jgi:hypothetical protein
MLHSREAGGSYGRRGVATPLCRRIRVAAVDAPLSCVSSERRQSAVATTALPGSSAVVATPLCRRIRVAAVDAPLSCVSSERRQSAVATTALLPGSALAARKVHDTWTCSASRTTGSMCHWKCVDTGRAGGARCRARGDSSARRTRRSTHHIRAPARARVREMHRAQMDTSTVASPDDSP